jgi:hypothetical protein
LMLPFLPNILLDIFNVEGSATKLWASTSRRSTKTALGSSVHEGVRIVRAICLALNPKPCLLWAPILNADFDNYAVNFIKKHLVSTVGMKVLRLNKQIFGHLAQFTMKLRNFCNTSIIIAA